MTMEYVEQVAAAVEAYAEAAGKATIARLHLGRIVIERPAETTVLEVVEALPLEVRRLLPEAKSSVKPVLSKAAAVFQEYVLDGGVQLEALARHGVDSLYANRPSATGVKAADIAARRSIPRRPRGKDDDGAKLPAAKVERSDMAAASEPANVTVTLSPATAKVAERLASDDKLPGITALLERLITAEATRRAKVGEAKRKRAERKAGAATA